MRGHASQCLVRKAGTSTLPTSVRPVRLHVGCVLRLRNPSLPSFRGEPFSLTTTSSLSSSSSSSISTLHCSSNKYSSASLYTLTPPRHHSQKMTVNSAIAALPAYKALNAYIKTASGDEKALQDTVEKLNDLARASESQLEDFLWDTYNAIFAVAKHTPPEKQGPLVDFVQQLRETTVTASDGQALHLSEGFVWKDLPTIGWVARDLWNFDVTDASASREEKASWDNLAVFLARLTSRASVIEGTADPLDYSTYGLWALRDAFETEHAANADTIAAVRHASLWIQYAGDAMKTLCARDHSLEAKVGVAGSKFGDRQWKGFNQERWSVWTEAFAKAQNSLPDEEAKSLAAQAVDIMKSK